MFQGDLPISFWGECILSATYLINHTPSRLLNFQTPYEMLLGEEPDYNELSICVFMLAHNHKCMKDKFAPYGRKCVFVGYSNTKKG